MNLQLQLITVLLANLYHILSKIAEMNEKEPSVSTRVNHNW